MINGLVDQIKRLLVRERAKMRLILIFQLNFCTSTLSEDFKRQHPFYMHLVQRLNQRFFSIFFFFLIIKFSKKARLHDLKVLHDCIHEKESFHPISEDQIDKVIAAYLRKFDFSYSIYTVY